jgi:hypothetical protein
LSIAVREYRQVGDSGVKIKRWIWILAMAPVMWGLLQMVIWADRLHAWQYSPEYAPPTATDFTRAAVVFWVALLTPITAGLVAAVVAFRRKYLPRWPVVEMVIVAFPYLAIATGELSGVLYRSHSAGNAFWYAIMWASLLVGGAVVVSLLNLGACVRERMWGKSALSTVVFGSGMLYLFWLNAFVIYIDT